MSTVNHSCSKCHGNEITLVCKSDTLGEIKAPGPLSYYLCSYCGHIDIYFEPVPTGAEK